MRPVTGSACAWPRDAGYMATETVRLIDQLSQILKLRGDLTTDEQLILKVAISALDQIDFNTAHPMPKPELDARGATPVFYAQLEGRQRMWDAWPWRVRLSEEEWQQAPIGVDELIDGQPQRKF
jgi:hypothetical protein